MKQRKGVQGHLSESMGYELLKKRGGENSGGRYAVSKGMRARVSTRQAGVHGIAWLDQEFLPLGVKKSP